MRVELLNLDNRSNNDVIEVKLFDEIDTKELGKNAYNGRYFGHLDIHKNGTTTDEQRKHYWAIIKDICNCMGWSKGEARLNTYSRFMFENDREDFISVGRNKASKEDATLLIQSCLNFCIDNDIPLNNDYSTYFDDKQLFTLIMRRKCFVCGKSHSDIAHVEAVGTGRDRRTIDHTKHHFMALCRSHHTEQHKIGIESFTNKYKLHGIKLSKENLRQLGVM